MSISENEMFIVSATIIHILLVAITKIGVAEVLKEMVNVNKLREWNDEDVECPVSALSAYHSTMLGAAMVNRIYALEHRGKETKDGRV